MAGQTQTIIVRKQGCGSGCATFLVVFFAIAVVIAIVTRFWYVVVPLVVVGIAAVFIAGRHQVRGGRARGPAPVIDASAQDVGPDQVTQVVVRENGQIIYQGPSPVPAGVVRPGHQYQFEATGPYKVL